MSIRSLFAYSLLAWTSLIGADSAHVAAQDSTSAALRSAPTAAESVRIIVQPMEVQTGVPYWVLRRADQLDSRDSIGRDSVVSRQPQVPGPQVPRSRPGYAYGWFGVSPRSHQQHKPSVYGLEQRYEWK